MPTLSASTSAVFTSIGLSATEIYNVFISLVGSSVSFALWLLQVSWPFLLGLAFIGLMWGIARRFLGVGH